MAFMLRREEYRCISCFMQWEAFGRDELFVPITRTRVHHATAGDGMASLDVCVSGIRT